MRQGAVRQAVTEVGHPPPDDETAERTGQQHDADAGQQGPDQEIVDHDPAGAPPPSWAGSPFPPCSGSGTTWPERS